MITTILAYLFVISAGFTCIFLALGLICFIFTMEQKERNFLSDWRDFCGGMVDIGIFFMLFFIGLCFLARLSL